jgi:MFS family permease
MKLFDIAKKIPRTVWYLGSVSFFNDVASEMLYPVMPIFLTQVLGAPVFIVGLIEGVAEGTASIFKALFGYWSDKLQKRKPFVVAGYGAGAVAKIIIALSYAWPTVLIGRVADRFGKGVRTGARDAMLNAASEPDNRGLIFGFHRSMDTLGAVVGPSIALVLLYFFPTDIRKILYYAAIPAFVSLFFFFFIREPKPKPSHAKLHLLASIKDFPPQYKFFLLGTALFSLGNSSDSFLILRAVSLGMSVVLTIAAYVVYNLVYALVSTPAGSISDRIGPKKVFIFGTLIFAFVYVGFAFNHHQLYIWPLFALYAFYIALTDGIGKALIGSIVSPEKIGTGYGVINSVSGIFTVLASVIGGLLWSFVAPEATFIFGAVCALLSLFFFLQIRSSV